MRRFFFEGLIICVTIFCMPGSIHAQDSLSNDESVLKEAAAFRAEIEKEKTSHDLDRRLWVDFRVDTFTIQKTLQAELNAATGRYDAGFAWSHAVNAYNKMAGTFYNQLMERMIEVDKQYLQNSQESWLAYKQAEQILNQIIGRKQYNKSGLINETYEYERMLEINKRRAIELFNYLLRVNNR